MEYCGEVCSLEEFEERKKVYSMEKRRHYYFMSLKADDVSYKFRNILCFKLRQATYFIFCFGTSYLL